MTTYSKTVQELIGGTYTESPWAQISDRYVRPTGEDLRRLQEIQDLFRKAGPPPLTCLAGDFGVDSVGARTYYDPNRMQYVYEPIPLDEIYKAAPVAPPPGPRKPAPALCVEAHRSEPIDADRARAATLAMCRSMA